MRWQDLRRGEWGRKRGVRCRRGPNAGGGFDRLGLFGFERVVHESIVADALVEQNC